LTRTTFPSFSDSRNRLIRGRAGGIDQSGAGILSSRFLNTGRSSSRLDHGACQRRRISALHKARDIKVKEINALVFVAEKLYATIEDVEKNMTEQLERSVTKPLISKLHSQSPNTLSSVSLYRQSLSLMFTCTQD
jgi:hypothetical protein